MAIAALGVALLVASAVAAAARAADPEVSVVDFSFEPATITVAAGVTVTWTVTRAQDPHTVSPVDPPDAFKGSSLLRQGDTFAVTFARPGTYRYQCTIHPEQMQGTVIVVAAGGTASPTTTIAEPTAAPTGIPSPTETSTSTAPGASGEPSGGGAPPTAVFLAVLAAAGLAGGLLIVRWIRRP